MKRDPAAIEYMDAPDCDPVKLERTYRRFRTINALFSHWKQTYRDYLLPQFSPDRTTSILDVGSGAGDLVAALDRWAKRDGFAVEITAIDPDVRAVAHMNAVLDSDAIAIRKVTTADLVESGDRFDLITSNHLVHHLDAAGLHDLLEQSERLLSTGFGPNVGLVPEPLSGRAPARLPRVVHSDITRSRRALLGFGVIAAPLAPGSFIRHDGLASIRRSSTPDELVPVLPLGWRVSRQGPNRHVLLFDDVGW